MRRTGHQPAIDSSSIALTSRFVGALGFGKQPREIFDTTLYSADKYVVVPTLGSIIPNWLLVIPREEHLNFALWERSTKGAVGQLLGELELALDFAGREIIWFEHGPVMTKSNLGCGLDRAHLHVLIDPPFAGKELFRLAKEWTEFEWQNHDDIKDCYSRIDPSQPYLCVGAGTSSLLAQNVSKAESQFWRKAVADLAHCHNAWDYKRHPNIDNVKKTILNFGAWSREHRCVA